jgi:hypothetical protein
MIKPSITEVVNQRVQLRKAGKEWIGLCSSMRTRRPRSQSATKREFFTALGVEQVGMFSSLS